MSPRHPTFARLRRDRPGRGKDQLNDRLTVEVFAFDYLKKNKLTRLSSDEPLNSYVVVERLIVHDPVATRQRGQRLVDALNLAWEAR